MSVNLDAIKDPHARATMKILFDRLSAIERLDHADVTVQTPTDTVDAAGQYRLTNLADAVSASDAVNQRTLRVHIRLRFTQTLTEMGVNVPPTLAGI